jgi:Ca2+-transporting ATPase
MRTLRTVFDLYPGGRDAGLSAAQAADSAARFGRNQLTPLPRDPAWVKFLGKFDEPIVKILLAATLLKTVIDLADAAAWAGLVGLALVAAAFALGLVPRLRPWVPAALFALAVGLVGLSAGLGHPSYEGLAVLVAVALATGVAFVSEHRSDREFEALNARKDAARVKVLRDAAVGTVGLEEVVVGDHVLLEAGDEIPADGRPVRAADLLVDQSLMTGESEPAGKAAAADTDEADGPDQPGCLYRGTQVVGGAGRMIVTHVGDDTMLGQIARRLSAGRSADDAPADPTAAAADRVQRKLSVSKESTPLQEKLEVLAGLISRVGYAAAALIFVALLGHGIWAGQVRLPAAGEPAGPVLLADFRAVLGYLVYIVIVIVVAVPEGLPMSVTVSLALAMRKMTRANALVRQLVACETVGSATVICTDKTGTLTENRMRVVRVAAVGRVYDGPEAAELAAGTDPVAHRLAVNAAVNSTAYLGEKDGQPLVIGSSTEGALLLWLRDGAGPDLADYARMRADHPVVHQSHFSSDRKRMATVVRERGGLVVYAKGAPEAILDRCTRVATPGGGDRPMTDDDRAWVRAELAAAAGHAMRTLGFAARRLPAEVGDGDLDALARKDELETDLVFTGFVGIRDPLRAEVREAVAACRAAGIRVTMITGDTAGTARAIAGEAGLLDRPDALVLTSDEFNALSDDELKARLPALRVLARAKPLDKYRLVRLLQEQGEVVGMTGDGTNDAVSLRRADVGLAMGLSGTEVAKEASQIVLLDDSFATIVKAIHWGRALYENIQKFIQFQLTINVSALVVTFVGTLLGLEPPFTVLQLLWINVIMDTFAAIALCSEPPRAGLMRVPPKRRDDRILTRAMLANIAVTGGFFVAAMLALLVGMAAGGWFAGGERPPGADLSERQVTVFFTAYVLFQVWNLVNCRSLSPAVSGLRGLWRNPAFLLIAAAIVVGQYLIVTFGGPVFHVVPLGWADWLALAAGTASVLVFAELARRIRTRLAA